MQNDFVCLFVCWHCAFGDLTLFVGYQEEHPACKNLTEELQARLSSGAKCI